MAEMEGVADTVQGGGLRRIVILLLVLLLIGVAVWFFLFKGKDEGNAQTQEVTETEPPHAPLFTEAWPFLVNLGGGNKFLKVTIQLMITDPLALAYLNQRTFEIKDIILIELQKLSEDEVDTAEDREKLRERILAQISHLYPNEPVWKEQPIYKILFLDFLVQ